MLTLNERITLRDKLINRFIELKILTFSLKYNSYIYTNKRKIKDKIKNDEETFHLYNVYISQFRSEEEALYCLRCKDDISNHICPICKNEAEFYTDGYNCNKYRITCNDVNCRESLANSESANKKRIQTCQERYNVDNTFQAEEFKQKAADTKEHLYGDSHYTNREKAKNTNRERYNVDWYGQCEDFLIKAIKTNRERYNVDWPAQNPDIISKQRITYFKNHFPKDPTTISEAYFLTNQTSLCDTYSNNDLFKRFIENLYIYKNRLLQLKELANIFSCKNQTIGYRIKELNLDTYFDIRSSLLELQFKDFLISNNYKENKDFTRYNHMLQTSKNTLQELDFLLLDYNISFEINDIMNHNIKEKNSTYHYNKTLMARDQHNIRLVHLWEWELNESNWFKTSQWILHLLNQNKIRLDLKIDCNNDIRLVDKDEALNFLNQYSLDNERRFKRFIGIYYNNELIELLSFMNDRIVSIYIKFGYELIEGTDKLLQSYIQYFNMPYLLTYTDLSKFTGKSLEDIGFKLLQYQKPNIIAEKKDIISKRKLLYNCGYNVYIFQ